MITIAACRSRNSNSTPQGVGQEIRSDRTRGMLILASSNIGEITIMEKQYSRFTKEVIDVINEYRKETNPRQSGLTIGTLGEKLNYPHTVGDFFSLRRATLIDVSKLKKGTHDLLYFQTRSDPVPNFISDVHVRYNIICEASRDKIGLEEDFKSFNHTEPSIPLFLYWSGRARTVGFHLFINDTDSINLKEFVACLNATGHKTIVLWLDCQFVIEDDIKHLREEMAKHRDKTLYIIFREASQQSRVFLLKHFERTTERWCNPNPQERLGSILSEIARECSVHVYPDPTAS